MMIERTLRTCRSFLLYAGIAAIVVGGVHIAVDVAARYLMGISVPGAMESSSMLLAIAAAAFFTITELEDMHVKSSLLVGRLPPACRRLLAGIYNIAMALVTLFLGYCVWLDARSSREFGDLSDVLLLPTHYFKFACAIAILIFFAVLVARGVRRILTFRSAEQPELW